MQPKRTGLYDERGVPVCVGDVLRVPSFRHYRYGEQMFQYFIVGQVGEQFVLHNVHEPDRTKYQILLMALRPACDVACGPDGETDDEGELITFLDRPRLRRKKAW